MFASLRHIRICVMMHVLLLFIHTYFTACGVSYVYKIFYVIYTCVIIFVCFISLRHMVDMTQGSQS